MLSGIAAALVLGAVSGMLSNLIWRRRAAAVFIGLGGVVTFFGAASAIEKGAFHKGIWDRHREVVAAVLSAAPRVHAGTVVVLLNVPRDADPFRHNMWFDLALRLSYPGVTVGGIYFYDDGSPASGSNLHIIGNEWRWDGTSFPPALRESGVSNTIVISYLGDGPARAQDDFPDFLAPGHEGQRWYRPHRVISDHRPAPEAIRRYGPIFQ